MSASVSPRPAQPAGGDCAVRFCGCAVGVSPCPAPGDGQQVRFLPHPLRTGSSNCGGGNLRDQGSCPGCGSVHQVRERQRARSFGDAGSNPALSMLRQSLPLGSQSPQIGSDSISSSERPIPFGGVEEWTGLGTLRAVEAVGAGAPGASGSIPARSFCRCGEGLLRRGVELLALSGGREDLAFSSHLSTPDNGDNLTPYVVPAVPARGALGREPWGQSHCLR